MADEKSNSATFEEEIIKATAKAAFELVWGIVGKRGTWTKEKVAVHNAMQCSSTLRLIANGTET
ncbi:MAG: hypothetical protein ACKVHE_11825 [Planctomycetales bacterium]|jgi:hypothetical protein